MISYEGEAKDFSTVLKDYCEFLQLYSDDTIEWELLDSRYNSFYGSTLAIPLEDYLADSNANMDILIMCDNGIMCEYLNDTKFKGAYRKNNRNFLPNVLKRIYPNSNVTIHTFDYYDSTWLDKGYLHYLQYTADNIDKLVFFVNNLRCGKDNINITSEFIRLLDEVDFECNARGIDVEYVYAPSYTYNKYFSSRYSESIDFINDVETIITKYSKKRIHNFYNVMSHFDDTALSNLSSYVISDVCGINVGTYKREISSLLTRFVLNSVFNISRKEAYVSMHYASVNSSTYRNFLMNYSDYMSEEFDKTTYENRSIHSKYSTLNPFRNTGELISVGIHTSFDYDLWMCEQGGITCKKEEDEPLNDINLLPFWRFVSGSPSKRLDIPVYPTTGCPWLTISNDNKTKYGISDTNPIHYYFTKTSTHATITVRIKDVKCQMPDVWQTMSFGRLECTSKKDNFYVAGGNQALSPDLWVYNSPSSKVDGFSYDLNIKNPSLANSNYLHPTKFGDANLSNVRIMDNSGTWQDVYAHTQKYKVIHYFSFSAIYKWGVPIYPPEHDIGEKNIAYPYNNDTRNKIDVYTAKTTSSPDKHRSRFQLDAVTYLLDS